MDSGDRALDLSIRDCRVSYVFRMDRLLIQTLGGVGRWVKCSVWAAAAAWVAAIFDDGGVIAVVERSAGLWSVSTTSIAASCTTASTPSNVSDHGRRQ